MERKNPTAVYFLIWITFGIYGVIWASDIMSEINRRNGNSIYNQKKIWIGIGAFFIWDFFLFSLIPKGGPLLFSIVFLQHLGWIGFLFFAVSHLASSIRKLQEKTGSGKLASPVKAFFLMPLWFTGIPYVQHHFNSLLAVNESKRVT